MGVISQLSVADALPVFSGNVLSVQSIVKFGRHVIKGAWLSSTTINWIQVLLLFPQLSVAIQVRVIVNSWGHVPAEVTSLKVIVGLLSQLSVAVALPVFTGKVLSVHSIVIFA